MAAHSTRHDALGAADRPHVAIIGGGITGLAAALELIKANDVQVTLIERDERLGGKIVTERLPGGFIIEGGPDSFVAQKPHGAALAREVGLGSQLTGVEPARHSAYVLIKGQPQPFPAGMMLIVPGQFMPFAGSPVLSPLGKLRMALDLVMPARRDDSDESLAAFVRRRLGREALDRMAEPLMAGIHSADPERQSMLATFPRFCDLERRYGSLIRGVRAQRRAAHRAQSTGVAASPFITLRDGIGTLVDALAARVGQVTQTSRTVTGVTHDASQSQPYRLSFADGGALHADALIVTTPSYAAAQLLAPLSEPLAAELRAIRYVSTATISVAYRRADVTNPLDGFGLIIPRSEGRRMNAITVVSSKFANRAPGDHLLLRVFVGGARTPEMMAEDDEHMLQIVRDELRAILHINAEPLFSRIYRWPDGNPQFDVGHLDRVRRIAQLSPAGIWLCGAAYDGVGIPDCIRQGQAAAQAALDHVRRQIPAPPLLTS